MQPIDLPLDKPGIVEAIEAAGERIFNRGGVWYVDNSEAVAAIVAAYEPTPPDLTKRQMAWLLVYTGLDEVWKQFITFLADFDRLRAARLAADKENDRYRYAVTISVLSEHSDLIAWLAPDADISADTIRSAWELAAKEDP